MKIAIAGAGALGGRVGTQIKQAGYDVTLIDGWRDHVEAINRDGMEIKTESDLFNLQIPAVHYEDMSEQYDLIIILTKAMDSEDMINALYKKNVVKDTTAILTMMNGLGHDERFSQLVPKEQIFLAVTMWTAGLRGPGQILLEGKGSISLQRADGQDDPRTHEINKIFNNAKLNSEVTDDVFEAIWAKATLNSVMNPMCTILNKRIREFAAYPNTREMITPIIEEIVAVANKKGVQIKFETMLNKIEAAYPDSVAGLHYPSMHQDLYHGRYTEVDYLNGQISKYGKEVGVATPNNDLITHLVHQLEMKFVK